MLDNDNFFKQDQEYREQLAFLTENKNIKNAQTCYDVIDQVKEYIDNYDNTNEVLKETLQKYIHFIKDKNHYLSKHCNIGKYDLATYKPLIAKTKEDIECKNMAKFLSKMHNPSFIDVKKAIFGIKFLKEYSQGENHKEQINNYFRKNKVRGPLGSIIKLKKQIKDLYSL